MKQTIKEADSLINYYSSNAYRMDYSDFKQIGASLIGPEAIESVHRTLVHKHMKQLGQRWSYEGDKTCLVSE